MTKAVRCPFCITDSPKKNYVFTADEGQSKDIGYICPNCREFVPRDYIHITDIPKASVGFVGFSGHGKTVYVTSLFLGIRLVENLWNKFFMEMLNKETLELVLDRVEQFKQGQLPDFTQDVFPRPSLVRLCNLPSKEDRFLTFYDGAGAIYEDADNIPRNGRFLAKADIAIFIFSIHDSGGEWQTEGKRLLGMYVLGVYDKLGINLKTNQSLIVVLSKADTIRDTLSQELDDFLKLGDFEWFSGDYNERIKTLKRKSKAIHKWLIENGAGGFVHMCDAKFKTVEYTMVSSMGLDVEASADVPNKIGNYAPKRVLDPLIWIVEMTRPSLWSKISSIVS